MVLPDDEEPIVCLFCDDPDLTAAECLQRVRDLVARDRFGIVSVTGSRCVAELSCTVGLTEHGAPELVVTGMRAADAGRLLRLWGDHLPDESAILPGETMSSGPWVMEAVQVTRPQDTLFARHQIYGYRVRALQLAWTDPPAAGRGSPVTGPAEPVSRCSASARRTTATSTTRTALTSRRTCRRRTHRGV